MDCGRIMSKRKCKAPCSWHEGTSPRWFHQPFGATGGRCSLKPFASAAALEAANRQTAAMLQDSHAVLHLLSGGLEAKMEARAAERAAKMEAAAKMRAALKEWQRNHDALEAAHAQRLAALAAKRRAAPSSSKPP